METLTNRVLNAINNSPNGIVTFDILKSLDMCDDFTLKTTLSRLRKSDRIITLKKGIYSTNPMTDAFMAANYIFGGYIGFSGALYLHKLITELPFSIVVVNRLKSGLKTIGQYEFRAVALRDKAIGSVTVAGITMSTRPKTLFDCLYLEKYSVELDKLIGAFNAARMTAKELAEFDMYVEKLIPKNKRQRFYEAKKRIIRDV